MWVNFGDINFAAYGGCLCRPHFGGDVDTSPIVDVLYFDPESTRDGKLLCVLMTVNTDELSPSMVYDILYAAGLENEMPSVDEEGRQAMFSRFGRGLFAKEAVSSGIRYSMSNINGTDFLDNELMYMTPEETVSYCSSIGAGEFVYGLA